MLGACRIASPPQTEPPAAVAPVTAEAAPAETVDQAPPPYTLVSTEVHTLRAERLGRSYPLLVSLPRSYARDPARRYPVLFVTDVNYAFPLVRSIGAMVGDKGAGLEDFILVGLGYADGDSPPYSRRRDYTPTANGPRDAKPEESGRPPLHGEAEAYRRFVADDVFPFVESHYRTDPARRIFAGHSYGALFGTHVLLTEPRMFERYILSSPSLWYDDRVMLARERDYAASHDDLPAKVFFAIGSYETVKPGSKDPRYNLREDMIADLRAFETQLRAHRYAGLQIASTVVPEEDHLGAYPVAITRGLRWALPPR
ncbi:MAG TPA: alpha/beta hydrolase-fold protein [Tahibacter sp.]|uniref:alpha/beta hydrolase n=1 Tax=Tahibacter sp. TaxID=2056211 RepID=UPI002C6E430D|nr:alpha/beta hydrolase-fold protein [Tahibacter sp.]HSX60208.1 alpha/beta hydrolase-fold protein [Tahibacter sp.]